MRLLAVFGALVLLHLALELLHGYRWWLGARPRPARNDDDDAVALGPRGSRNGLLVTLFVGLAWLPIAFAVAYLDRDVLGSVSRTIGLAACSLNGGCSGGHSGPPLTARRLGGFVVDQLIRSSSVAESAGARSNGMHGDRGRRRGARIHAVGCCASARGSIRRPRADGKPRMSDAHG